MKTFNSTLPSTESVLAMVYGELSSMRRWVYRFILIVTSAIFAAIISLWISEPGILPLRLHASFAVMSVIGAGWIGVLSYILLRRHCPTALDRITTAWMATAACVLFLTVSIPICVSRGDLLAVLSVVTLGLTLLGMALSMLYRAYWLKRRLLAKLAELEAK